MTFDVGTNVQNGHDERLWCAVVVANINGTVCGWCQLDVRLYVIMCLSCLRGGLPEAHRRHSTYNTHRVVYAVGLIIGRLRPNDPESRTDIWSSLYNLV